MKNKIIIISSPSGAGKTTICKKLLNKIKNIEISVSYTTRPKRKIEKDSKDYFFTNNINFLKLKKRNYFILLLVFKLKQTFDGGITYDDVPGVQDIELDLNIGGDFTQTTHKLKVTGLI